MRPSFDEMQLTPDSVRDHYAAYERWLARQPGDVMKSRREEAEVIFRRVGITFAVYGAKDDDGAGTERLIPFDLIPRVIPAPRVERDGARPAPARDGAEPLRARCLPRAGHVGKRSLYGCQVLLGGFGQLDELGECGGFWGLHRNHWLAQ